ncbi:MAG: acetate--CoA ligase family protein [Candidatus Micrarchaeia archaeon]
MLLEYFEAKKILDKYGIRSIDSAYVDTGKEAIEFAGKEPIVLKAISEKAMHKSKAGLVKLNLEGEEEISAAYRTLEREAKPFAPYKILAQKMSKGGVETIIGGSVDAQFGKVMLIGLGGVYVEAFRDTAMRLCPITRYDAEEMLLQLKSRNVITYNGAARRMLVDLLLRFSKMFSAEQGIKEIDLNPVIVRKDSYEAVDLRMIA